MIRQRVTVAGIFPTIAGNFESPSTPPVASTTDFARKSMKLPFSLRDKGPGNSVADLSTM
jgi:hypothetical protein